MRQGAYLVYLISAGHLSTVGGQGANEFLGLVHLGGVIKVQPSNEGTGLQDGPRTLYMVEAVGCVCVGGNEMVVNESGRRREVRGR